MERSERQERIASHLLQVQLVVAMIVSSAVLLAGVIFLLANAGKLRPLAADAATVEMVLGPLAVTLLGLAPMLKRAVYKRAEARSERGFGGDVEAWLGAHRAAVVLASALREGAAVLGFLMALLGAQPFWSYVFSLLAVANLVYDWPKAGDLEER